MIEEDAKDKVRWREMNCLKGEAERRRQFILISGVLYFVKQCGLYCVILQNMLIIPMRGDKIQTNCN